MELWTVNAEAHRIVHIGTAAGQLFPTWLPNGDLGYASGGMIWIVHPDGTGKHRYPAPAGATAPAARPDSTQIASSCTGASRRQRGVGHGRARPACVVALRQADRVPARRRELRLDGPGRGRQGLRHAEPRRPGVVDRRSRLAFAAGSDVWIAGPGAARLHRCAQPPRRRHARLVARRQRVAFSWRGGVDEITLPGHASHIASSTGIGTAYTAMGILEYSGSRSTCPGHHAIVIGARVATGSCLVTGTAKADVIEGTPLWGDVIQAGAGNDSVHANDGHTDRVDCGPGHDTVWADRTDSLVRCEVVHR